jgi:predicted nucleic acid-binding protein
MICVADACLTIKWYVPENHSTPAEILLNGSYEIHAPELIIPEFGNIVWKKQRAGIVTPRAGARIIDAFAKQRIPLHSQKPLLRTAYRGAQVSGQTAYDWMYLSLALSLSCPFITANERFYNALENTKMKRNLIWIGDL